MEKSTNLAKNRHRPQEGVSWGTKTIEMTTDNYF